MAGLELQVFLLTQIELPRLSPFTDKPKELPECLMPIGNRTVLDLQLEMLGKWGEWIDSVI